MKKLLKPSGAVWREDLIKALESEGRLESGLTEAVADKLQLPRACQGLFRIAENICRLEAYLAEIGREEDGLEDILNWAQAVLDIPESHRLRSVGSLIGVKKIDDSIAPPLHGIQMDHPIWCSLWFRHGSDDEEAQELYRWLQAHYLAAHARIVGEGLKLKRDGWVYQAGLSIRQLHQPTRGHVLLELVDRFNGDYETARPELFQSVIASTSDSGLRSLAEMLRVAYELDTIEVFEDRESFKHRKGLKRSRHRNWINHNLLQPDHTAYLEYSNSKMAVSGYGTDEYVVHQGTTSSQRQSELEKKGIHSGEYAGTDHASIDTEQMSVGDAESGDLGELPPIQTLYAAGRAKARHIVMEVQRFRVAPNRIRPGQVRRIIENLEALYQRASGRNQPELLETLRLAAVSLVTGNSPDALRRLPIVKSVKNLPDTYKIALNQEFGMWIRPYRAPERNVLQIGYLGNRTTTWPRVVFEDVLGVGRQVESRDGLAFTRRISTYKNVWKKHVLPQLRGAGLEERWCRLASMASILPSWFRALEEGDHLSVAILFGQTDPMAEVHRYYTAFPRESLAQKYRQNVTELWESLKVDHAESGARLFELQASSVQIDKIWVGNDRVPKAGALKELVDTLKTNLHKVRDPLESHNLMALYTGIGLAISTGFRAVRTPVKDLTSIHKPTATLCLQEKDRVDGSHGRVVVLPRVVTKQVDAYLRHTRKIAFRLGLNVPIILEARTTKQRDKSQFDESRYELDIRKTLFFLHPDRRDNLQPVEFTGQWLKSHADAVVEGKWLVENAGRHFLRSYLAKEGCPPTVINALMGHWHYGEEVWVSSSSFDPVRFREVVRPYLDQLMDDIGFEAIAA